MLLFFLNESLLKEKIHFLELENIKEYNISIIKKKIKKHVLITLLITFSILSIYILLNGSFLFE